MFPRVASELKGEEIRGGDAETAMIQIRFLARQIVG
jgi:hypothetical protein